MPTTSNFGWTTPADTDLVKDGAAAIRTLGNGIDTSLVDLKGGTTGQVLSKASNTDLDFSWVAQDDSNAIQNALLTTTGDTIYASAASTPARLGIGTTGQVLTVAGGVPSWATPSSGGMTLISTTTLSGVSTTLSSIPQTYNSLYLVITGVTANTSHNRIQCLPNNVNNLSNLEYQQASANSSQTNAVIRITTSPTNRTNANNAFILQFHNYTSTSTYKPFNFFGGYVDDGNTDQAVTAAGYFRSNTAIDSLVFNYGGTNTFSAGTILLYGVK